MSTLVANEMATVTPVVAHLVGARMPIALVLSVEVIGTALRNPAGPLVHLEVCVQLLLFRLGP